MRWDQMRESSNVEDRRGGGGLPLIGGGLGIVGTLAVIGISLLLGVNPLDLLSMSGGGQPLPADMLFALPAFKATPAARDQRLVTLPGSYLLGFGPRTPQAVRDLAQALHPGAQIAPLPTRAWAAGTP